MATPRSRSLLFHAGSGVIHRTCYLGVVSRGGYMGEIADMMLDGTLCEGCGGLMEDLIPDEGNELKAPPGHARLCPDCEADDE